MVVMLIAVIILFIWILTVTGVFASAMNKLKKFNKASGK